MLPSPDLTRSNLVFHALSLAEAARRSPVRVIRHLTAGLTQQPEHPDGMMLGRWSRDFPGYAC